MKNIFNLLQIFAQDKIHTTDGVANASSGTVSPYPEGGGLSPESRKYYSDYLIDNAEPNLVHMQFGQKRPIPKNGGKSVQFRRYSALGKANTPLTEGVTPTGTLMDMGTIEATVYQYGAYIELSDMLIMTAIDNNIVEATKLLGSQAGRTIDSVIRDVLISEGTNVQYADGRVDSRVKLVGGEESGNDYMTVDCIRRAARALKAKNVDKINGSYVAIIHPDVSYDLMNDPKWESPKAYCDPQDLYNGEIGRIGGVRFVESSEAKVIEAEKIIAGSSSATIVSYTTASSAGTAPYGEATVNQLVFGEAITADEAAALVGKEIELYDASAKTVELASVVGADAVNKKLFLKSAPAGTYESGDKIYAANAGALGRSVYCTLVIGENAYGVIDIAGGGIEHIVKQLGSAGTGDPINQRATVGWKSAVTACILAQEAIVRIETASSFESDGN